MTFNRQMTEHADQNLPQPRGPALFTRPATIVVLILAVHVFARAASFNHYHKVDSYTLGIAAYKMWRPGAEFADLVVDKPPGQGLLTGWSFYLFPGDPTRLALIPVESAFLIAAYAVFWLIARRWLNPVIAAAATLFFSIAHNTYNVLDFTTDGFNLGESYLALPMLLACLSHNTLKRPIIRGLAQGFAVGTALSIKQSALGLCAVLFLHELWTQRRSLTGAVMPLASTLLGMLLAALPSVVFLAWHGWLRAHLLNLWRYTGVHGEAGSVALPAWYNVEPLLPCLWWLLLGMLAFALGRCRSPVPRDDGVARNSMSFLLLWLLVELAIVWAMTKPSSHYYQQLAAPIALIAGIAYAGFWRYLHREEKTGAADAIRWAGVVTAVLALVASRPIFAEASRRIPTFDYRREIEDFQAHLQMKPVVGVRLPEVNSP